LHHGSPSVGDPRNVGLLAVLKKQHFKNTSIGKS